MKPFKAILCAVLVGSFFSNIGLATELKVDFGRLSGFSVSEKTKIEHAADLLEKVVNSQEFRQAVLNFTYQGKKNFVQNGGLTNAQIYSQIQSGREILNGQTDHAIDLSLSAYYDSNSGVIGYTYPTSLMIYINRYFFSNFSEASVAGNLFHEWTHKIGFEHDFDRTARRPYSVPYALGNLVVKIANKFEN